MATDIPNKYAIPFLLALGVVLAFTVASFIPRSHLSAAELADVARMGEAAPAACTNGDDDHVRGSLVFETVLVSPNLPEFRSMGERERTTWTRLRDRCEALQVGPFVPSHALKVVRTGHCYAYDLKECTRQIGMMMDLAAKGGNP